MPFEGEQGTGGVAPAPSTALAPEKHEAVPIENDGVPIPDERPEHSEQPEDVLPRRLGQTRPDHDYWLLDNPDAWRPGAWHKKPTIAPGTADPNSDVLLDAMFNALHGDAMLNEAHTTLEEAKKRADWPQWKEAMEKADLPKDRKPILCRWVYCPQKKHAR